MPCLYAEAESKGWIKLPLNLTRTTTNVKSNQQMHVTNICGVTFADWSSVAVRTNELSVAGRL
jgi:hypothetical protein